MVVVVVVIEGAGVVRLELMNATVATAPVAAPAAAIAASVSFDMMCLVQASLRLEGKSQQRAANKTWVY
jgi:hypothetical protein